METKFLTAMVKGGVVLVSGARRKMRFIHEAESKEWVRELFALLQASPGMSVVIDMADVDWISIWMVHGLIRLDALLSREDIRGNVRVWNACPHVLAVVACLIPGICRENDVTAETIFGSLRTARAA